MTELIDDYPQHIAVIMDGNGRWAKQRGKHRYAGHLAGVQQARNLIETCVDLPVKVLTLFAFSSENWRRPALEVRLLLNLFLLKLRSEIKTLHANQVCFRLIGDVSAFPDKLQNRVSYSEDLTQNNQALLLQVAANYGGRWDLTQATRRIAAQVAQGELQPEDITEAHISQNLAFPDVPDPDLFIRTGGEVRISNFMLWQCAYTECYFTDTLWPDFDAAALQQALHSFANRQRRFGRTGEQLKT